jgi:hypothetical protein
MMTLANLHTAVGDNDYVYIERPQIIIDIMLASFDDFFFSTFSSLQYSTKDLYQALKDCYSQLRAFDFIIGMVYNEFIDHVSSI